MDNVKNDEYYIEKILSDLEFIIEHTKGKTKDEIENLSDQMMNMLDGDSFEMGGSGLIPDFMSNMFGLWLFETTSNSTNIFSNAGSRLIRHQTSIGRNFGVPQGEDWTY